MTKAADLSDSGYDSRLIDPPKRASSNKRVFGLELIQATAKALLLSGGRVIVIASLTAEECEHLAIELRAETGVVPYGLWIALTDKGREKLAVMSLAMAQRILDACT